MLRATCPRCGRLVPYGVDCPCSAQSKRERNRTYDNTVRYTRDADLTSFYHSPEWRAMQQYIINKYDGLDVYAYLVKHEIVPASVVHHITPLREVWGLRLDEDNLIPLSAESHGEIESMYKTKKRETQTLLKRLLDEWKFLEG